MSSKVISMLLNVLIVNPLKKRQNKLPLVQLTKFPVRAALFATNQLSLVLQCQTDLKLKLPKFTVTKWTNFVQQQMFMSIKIISMVSKGLE